MPSWSKLGRSRTPIRRSALRGHASDGGASEPGWLLCEVTEVSRSRGSLAVLDAQDLAGGPLAMIRLNHHIPIEFHGEWNAST